MKVQEYIILPLLSIAVGIAAFVLNGMAAGVPADYLLCSLADNPLILVAPPLVILGIPGTWLADRFRSYPERVRLSPVSFGLIAVIPATLIPGCRFIWSLCIGNAVMALTVLSMARFKPGKRLGVFEPIPFKKTLLPGAVSLVPLIVMLWKQR